MRPVGSPPKEVSAVRGSRSVGSLVLSVIGIDSPPAGVEAAPKGLCSVWIFWIYGSIPVNGHVIIIVIPFAWDERGFISCWVCWIIAAFSHHKYKYEF